MRNLSLLLLIFAALASPGRVPHAQADCWSLWVTRWDYKSAEDVMQIMENVKQLGIDRVLFQVRGNATVDYPSKIEPWGWELTGKDAGALGRDPGWDPLATAIREAHRRGLQLHAWMNVLPGWRGLDPPPRGSRQPWANHRNWFMVDHLGVLMWPTQNFYTFLSPGHPQARSYLASVFGEAAKRYPQLDGIHMDYVRYPAQQELGTFRDFSYDDASVSAFKKKYKKKPAPDLPEWEQFKCAQVAETIRMIHSAIRNASPTLPISATFVAEIDRATSETGQDPRIWLSEHWVDWVIPMAYKRSSDKLMETLTRLDQVVDPKWKESMNIGLNLDFNSTGEIRNQMELVSVGQYGGAALFAYNALYPDHQPNGKAKTVQTIIRDERLKSLILNKTKR